MTALLRRLRPKHVRTRLTLWYGCVLASGLLLSCSLTASFLFLQLRSQLDHYAIQDIETVEGLLYFDAAGHLTLREDYHNHLDSKLLLDRLLAVRSPNDVVIYRNARLGDRSLGGDPFAGEGEDKFSPRSERLADGTRIHIVSRRYNLDGRSLLIRLAYSEEPLWERLKEFSVAAMLAMPIVLVMAGLTGYALARRALAPLEEMACRAEQITSDRLHERLPPGEVDDELGHLARVFNKLLARLEQSFEQLRRFTSDASHELRTPLTSIRSVGEVALQKDGSCEEYRDTIGSMLEEVNRLTALVDSLLTISRADAGRIPLNPTTFSAMDLAREAASLFEVLIDEKDQHVNVEGDESARITGDRVFLRQAVVNIIHNAVKYSPIGGTIAVTVYNSPVGSVRIEVADSGPGIAPEHSERIFDRFYRVDESRSRDAGGAGLAIAQWAVRVHGGELHLLMADRPGCTFQLLLPPVAANLRP
jgi:heavy metal sensor kinase